MQLVFVQPSTVTSSAPGHASPHIPSISHAATQGVPSLQAASPPFISSPPSISHEFLTTNENVPDLESIFSTSQPVRSLGTVLDNISQAQVARIGETPIGLSSMGGVSIGMHMSNMIPNGMASSVPTSQTVLSFGQSSAISGFGSTIGSVQPVQNSTIKSLMSATSNISENPYHDIYQPQINPQGMLGNIMGQPVSGIGQIPAMLQSGTSMNLNMMSKLGSSGAPFGIDFLVPSSGMAQQVQLGMQSIGVSNSASNMPMSQQVTTSLISSLSKYIKVWEVSSLY